MKELSCTHQYRAVESHFIHLHDNRVQNFSFERSEYNRFVFNWVYNEALSGLNDTGSNTINGGDSNHKTVSNAGMSILLASNRK